MNLLDISVCERADRRYLDAEDQSVSNDIIIIIITGLNWTPFYLQHSELTSFFFIAS